MKYFEMFRGKIDKEGEAQPHAASAPNAYHDSHDTMGPAHARDLDLSFIEIAISGKDLTQSPAGDRRHLVFGYTRVE